MPNILKCAKNRTFKARVETPNLKIFPISPNARPNRKELAQIRRPNVQPGSVGDGGAGKQVRGGGAGVAVVAFPFVNP